MHLVGLAILYHLHLIIKLCLVSMLEDFIDNRHPNETLLDSFRRLRKSVYFNVGTVIALFSLENFLILPKQDWIRVIIEGLGLVAIALFDYF